MVTNELDIVKNKSAAAQQIDFEVKLILRQYLDIFYVAIYRVRLLVEMSKQIGDQGNRLIYENLWGFFKNNVIIGSIVVEVFSIFDKKSGSLIKEFQKKLKENNINPILFLPIEEWIQKIKKYENVRHKIFAHKDINPPYDTTIMYEDFLCLLDKFEEKLLLIDDNYLPDVPHSTAPRITSKLDLNSPILDKFKKLLSVKIQP